MEADVFKAYTLQHGLPILVIALIGLVAILMGRSAKTDLAKRQIGLVVSLIATLGVILRMGFFIKMGSFDFTEELPLHLCRVMALVAPFAIYYKKRKWLGVLYFMILAGTLQANITPDIKPAFPDIRYFAYWMMHTALLIVPFYAIFVYKLRFNFEDFKNAFAAGNVYLILITAFNFMIGANYFYTIHKPESRSLLDLFGPWPVYILVTWFITIVLFTLLYLPFYFGNRGK